MGTEKAERELDAGLLACYVSRNGKSEQIVEAGLDRYRLLELWQHGVALSDPNALKSRIKHDDEIDIDHIDMGEMYHFQIVTLCGGNGVNGNPDPKVSQWIMDGHHSRVKELRKTNLDLLAPRIWITSPFLPSRDDVYGNMPQLRFRGGARIWVRTAIGGWGLWGGWGHNTSDVHLAFVGSVPEENNGGVYEVAAFTNGRISLLCSYEFKTFITRSGETGSMLLRG
ncbi:Hypothetical protein D9617_13g099860 [Elsinoe fawcettii]|nr:Hypothetical protein D9617_13g099860 [Elsinoe fawcettii]